MKIIIDVNEKSIDAFKEKIEEAGLKVKEKYNEGIDVLEQGEHDLKKKLEEYKDEGQSKWKKFKKNIKHDKNGIERTMKDLFKTHKH